MFTDEGCNYEAGSAEFSDLMCFDLPYSQQSIIRSGSNCASCKEHFLEQDKRGGNDKYDEYEVLEQCEDLMSESELIPEYVDASGYNDIEGIQHAEGVE